MEVPSADGQGAPVRPFAPYGPGPPALRAKGPF